MRGLNETGGRNRLKFQKLKSRVKQARARVDVVHKVRMCDVMAYWMQGWYEMGWDWMGTMF